MSIEPAPSPPSADPRTVTLPPNGRTPANGDPTPHGSAPTLEAPGAALGAAVPFGRDFGDYELLEEIARGGMGVIFKARQKSLQRVVALKMILAGQLASPEQVRRFHFEAEQAAALDHPNIVPIYQVGEIFGQHYFSMKLVEGGSLATRMPELRKDLQTGVRVLVQVARAVHYAHQRGVLHRDLKPSNILLEGKAGSGNPPVPHVADFGLAKHLNATPGGGAETQSGAVVGTPGYVAPEQASARKDLTTAVDVYSLGAILYELLTGRPPFQAASPLDTLLLAMEKDPVRPRSLAPGVPRDLETICLTCLAKEPARRYASADALANDLERFLKGEPIRARPIGFFERAVKWAKRRPAAAALVGVSALAILALTVGGWWYNAQLHVALQVAEDRRKEAEENNARAERNLIKSDANFAKARDAVDKLLTRVVEGRLSQIRNMEGVRQEFLQEALAFYKEFLNEKSDDPAIRQEAGRAYRRVGDVKRLLKEYTKGEESYKEALRLQEKLAADFPREPAYREDQSLTLRNLAELLKAANRPRDAEEVYRKAEALLGSLVDEFPEVPDYRQKLAINYHWLALLLKGEGWREESVKAFREALRLQERLAADHPAVPTYHAELATTRHNLGQVLATPRPTEAVGVRLVPTTSAPFGLLAFACSAAAPDFLLDGCQGPDRRAELVAALELYRGACDAQREALRLTPTSAPYRSTLRLSDYSQLFATLKRLRDHEGLARAAEALRQDFADSPVETYNAAAYLAVCSAYAGHDERLTETERQQRAQSYGDRAMAVLRDAVEAGYKNLAVLSRNSDLDVLRSRNDFRGLVANLKQRVPEQLQSPTRDYWALLGEYRAAVEDNFRAQSLAKTPEERNRLAAQRPTPTSYASRFLDLAQRNPEASTAVDSLIWVAVYVTSQQGRASRDKALQLLGERYAQDPKMGQIVQLLGASTPSQGLRPLSGPHAVIVRAVGEKNEDRVVRGRAQLLLARSLKKQADSDREHDRPSAAERETRAEQALATLLRDYADEPALAADLVLARKELHELKHLGIGRAAPEIEGEDTEGKPFKLSEYRGKVVVLDFWVDWCTYCREMYPHERELAKRLEGKPFALLGINTDNDLSEVKAVMAKEKMTWRSWWDGGPKNKRITQQWNVSAYPYLYVLDHKGIIRYKGTGFRGAKLDAAVSTLLKEMEAEAGTKP